MKSLLGIRAGGAMMALLIGAVMIALAGCATGGGYGGQYGGSYGPPARCVHCGVVKEVRQVYISKDSSTAGTVLGAIIGGVLGSTVGKGDGRKAATVVGAVAGGAVGHEVGKSQAGQEPAWQVVIRLDDGRLMTVTQREDPRVREGDYVEVRNDHVYLR